LTAPKLQEPEARHLGQPDKPIGGADVEGPNSEPVNVNIYINSEGLPPEFNVAAVQNEMQAMLAGVHVKINIIVTNKPRSSFNNLGTIMYPTPVSDKGLPVRPDFAKEINTYVEFSTGGRLGIWVASTVDWQWVALNMTEIRNKRWNKQPQNLNILFANILLHEIFYHVFLNCAHIPFVPFEQTRFGRSEANPHSPINLTRAEKDWLNRYFDPRLTFRLGR
jgi:hypothetical protein